MTSIKFHLRPSTKAGYSEGKLFIRIIHKRKLKNLPTDYKVFPHEWDEVDRKILLPENDRYRLIYLNNIQCRMADDISRIKTAIGLLSRNGDYTVNDIARSVDIKFNANTLMAFSERLGAILRNVGRDRTARAYRSAAKSLIRYNGGVDLKLAGIDEELIKGYEKHLKEQGLEMNTISFYMRNLRAIYFRAVRARVILPRLDNPFLNVYTGVHESRKKALNHEQLNALGSLAKAIGTKVESLSACAGLEDRTKGQRQIMHHQGLQASLLYFMFSYHARGMSFVDLAYLRKSDIKDGWISYCRHKTGRPLNVMITEPMQGIIDMFADKTRGSEFVFPVIDIRKGPARRQYESGLRVQNKRLKVLGRMAGIGNLSSHVARHTWATLAKKQMVDIHIISEALGHSDVRTTQRYLDSFDMSTMGNISKQMSGLILDAA